MEDSVVLKGRKHMLKKFSVEFNPSQKPITGLVTKFGGQPVWVNQPEWPLSKSTCKPMRFICQIVIDPQMFHPVSAQVAYLFMTDDEDYVDGTWEPDGGENAVILQLGQNRANTQSLREGPTLYRMVKRLFHKELVPEACEFSVVLNPGEDPDFVEEKERWEWDEAKQDDYAVKLQENKIGGTPYFIQRTEFPGPGKWRLLLQLDMRKVPFFINFGDLGVGYVFLSEDGQTAKFLWQCS